VVAQFKGNVLWAMNAFNGRGLFQGSTGGNPWLIETKSDPLDYGFVTSRRNKNRGDCPGVSPSQSGEAAVTAFVFATFLAS
jgi:hypothetical protein